MLDEEEKRPNSDQCFGDASAIANQMMVGIDSRELKSHEVKEQNSSRFNQKAPPQMEFALVDQNGSSDKAKSKYSNLDEFSPQAKYDGNKLIVDLRNQNKSQKYNVNHNKNQDVRSSHDLSQIKEITE